MSTFQELFNNLLNSCRIILRYETLTHTMENVLFYWTLRIIKHEDFLLHKDGYSINSTIGSAICKILNGSIRCNNPHLKVHLILLLPVRNPKYQIDIFTALLNFYKYIGCIDRVELINLLLIIFEENQLFLAFFKKELIKEFHYKSPLKAASFLFSLSNWIKLIFEKGEKVGDNLMLMRNIRDINTFFDPKFELWNFPGLSKIGGEIIMKSFKTFLKISKPNKIGKELYEKIIESIKPIINYINHDGHSENIYNISHDIKCQDETSYEQLLQQIKELHPDLNDVNILQDNCYGSDELEMEVMDKYKDFITNTILINPVILPSNNRIDESTYVYMLLTSGIDPFSRISLTSPPTFDIQLKNEIFNIKNLN